MNNKRYLVLASVVISLSVLGMQKSTPRIPLWIYNIKKFGPLDPKIGTIIYAPNHPLTVVSREKVFAVTPDRVAQEAYEFVTLADTKNGYKKTFRSVTLRDGKCTSNNCFQQTIGILSDINTLKVPTNNIDAAAKKLEIEYGKISHQKYESVTVDSSQQLPGVISACLNCAKIKLIFPPHASSNTDKNI